MKTLKVPFEAEQIEHAVIMYREGVSLQALSFIFHTSREYMRRKLLLHTPLKAPGRVHNTTRKKQKRRFLDPQTYFPYIKALYVEREISLPQIAQIMNAHTLDVRDMLSLAGVQLRHKGARRSQDASQIVNKAIRDGILTRGPCERANCTVPAVDENGKAMTIGHHDDYNFPLQVRWLCPSHHAEWHAHNTPIMQGETPDGHTDACTAASSTEGKDASNTLEHDLQE